MGFACLQWAILLDGFGIERGLKKLAIDPESGMTIRNVKHSPLKVHEDLVHPDDRPVRVYRRASLQEVRHGGMGVKDDDILIEDAQHEHRAYDDIQMLSTMR